MENDDQTQTPESMGLRREPRADMVEVAKVVLFFVAVCSFAVAPLLAG